MKKHAVINKDNKVINIIMWDGVSQWQPPQDHIVIESETAHIDDNYNPQDKTFTRSK